MSYIKTINLKKKIDNDILLKNINVNIEKGKVISIQNGGN